MKEINITSGEELNKILTAKYPDKHFIPFNEAMIKGSYTAPLFSDEFINQRAATHGVTADDYLSNMAKFLDFLENLDNYSSVCLYFGDEPFCQANLKAVTETLSQRGYSGELTVRIVDEYTGECKDSWKIATV